MAAAGDAITELTLDDTSYLIATGELDAAATSRTGTGVHVLPGFDEYLLAYQDRSHALALEHAQRIVPGNNGIFLPIIVADGRVVGTWRRTPKSKTAAIEADHFTVATKAIETGFASAAKAYARFVTG